MSFCALEYRTPTTVLGNLVIISTFFVFLTLQSVILFMAGDQTGTGKRGEETMRSFTKWDCDGYHRRVGEEEAARRRRAIMAEQWSYQLAEEPKRLGSHNREVR